MTSSAVAAAAGVAATPSPGITPEVTRLLEAADHADKEGNIGVALIELKEAVRTAPQNPEVHAQLGIAMLKAGDPLAAERELRDARSIGAPDELVVPPFLEAMIRRDEANQILDQFAEPRVGAKSGVAADIMRARALAYEMLGHKDDADAAMDRSLAIRRDGLGLSTRARLAADQGDLAHAHQLIDEAMAIAPKDPEVLAARAAIEYQSGDLNKALAAADDFVRQSPLSTAAKVIRIEVLLAMKQDALAEAEVDALEAQSPNSPFLKFYRGVLLARAGDFKGAWSAEQSLAPEFVVQQPSMAMKVAEIAVSAGNAVSAEAILAALVSRRPALAEAQIRLASLQLGSGNSDAAINTIEPIQNSNDPRVQTILGEAQYRLGRFTDAMASFQKGIRASAGADNDFLKQELGQAALDFGDSDTAIRNFKEVLAHSPGKWNAAEPVISALMQQRKTDEALDVVNRTARGAGRTPLAPYYRGRILPRRAIWQERQRPFRNRWRSLRNLRRRSIFAPMSRWREAIRRRGKRSAADHRTEPVRHQRVSCTGANRVA